MTNRAGSLATRPVQPQARRPQERSHGSVKPAQGRAERTQGTDHTAAAEPVPSFRPLGTLGASPRTSCVIRIERHGSVVARAGPPPRPQLQLAWPNTRACQTKPLSGISQWIPPSRPALLLRTRLTGSQPASQPAAGRTLANTAPRTVSPVALARAFASSPHLEPSPPVTATATATATRRPPFAVRGLAVCGRAGPEGRSQGEPAGRPHRQ
ncbi:hypothetical protein M432DRAFT_636626 [Thermoascus aurantiacus ATCC 26904]